jgi:hypothetical protein
LGYILGDYFRNSSGHPASGLSQHPLEGVSNKQKIQVSICFPRSQKA